MCGGAADALSVSASHFEGLRKGWHIDGTPNNFLPGLTDHFGTIVNFDVLVGCLLSDVPEPMAGELCVYPGSHHALASYFANHVDELVNLRSVGSAHLPTGQQTDALFKRRVVHCTGKAGDVFLANYMTAHLIAPNTSADIRYAVYFRLTGPLFEAHAEGDGSHPRSMLSPWVDWSGLPPRPAGEDAEEADEQAVARALDALRQRRQPPGAAGLEAVEQKRALERQLSVVNYDYLQAQKSSETVMTSASSALAEMFPGVDAEIIADTLAACGGNEERAVAHLVEMS